MTKISNLIYAENTENCKLDNKPSITVPEPLFMDLPEHLRKSYIIVVSKGECDAALVANHTGRCRAIESNYLNQLTRMGWLNKRRISKTVHFRPVENV